MPKKRVTTMEKACLAGSAYLTFFCISIISSALMKYFTDYVLLPAVMFGTAHLFFGVWTALCNIVVGGLSDNIRSKVGKGKRLTFIRRSIPVMVIGYLLWMVADPDASNALNTTFLVLGFAAMGVGATMFGINHASLVLNITDDIDERTSINIWNAVLVLVPGVITGSVPAYFFMEGYSFDFVRLLLSGAGIFMVAISWFCASQLCEPEGVVEQSDGNTPQTISGILKGFGASLVSVFQSKSFVVYAIYNFLFAMVASVYFSNATYYLGNVLMVTGAMAGAVAIAGPVLEYAFYPIVRKLRNSAGTHKTMCLGLMVLSLSYLVMYFTEGYWPFIILYSAFHIGLAANWLLSLIMLGEIIEEDHLLTGRKRSGLFFGINGVLVVPAGSLMIFLFSVIIDYTGYDPQASQLTELAEQGIRMGGMLLPAVISAAAFVVLYFFFPLKGDYYKDVRRRYHEQYGRKI
ncbi:MAG: MFS transporter [Endozoicomonas sp.]